MNSVTNSFPLNGFNVILANTDIGLIISAEDQNGSQVYTRKLVDEEIKALTSNLYTNTTTLYTALLDGLEGQYPQIKISINEQREMIYSFSTRIGSQERTITFVVPLGLSNGMEKQLELAYVKLGQQAKEIETLKREKTEIKDRLKDVSEKFNRVEARLSKVENEVKDIKPEKIVKSSVFIERKEQQVETHYNEVSSSALAGKNVTKSPKTPSPRGRVFAVKKDKELPSRIFASNPDDLYKLLRTPSPLRDADKSSSSDCPNQKKENIINPITAKHLKTNQKEENVRNNEDTIELEKSLVQPSKAKEQSVGETNPFSKLLSQSQASNSNLHPGLFANKPRKFQVPNQNLEQHWFGKSQTRETVYSRPPLQKAFEQEGNVNFVQQGSAAGSLFPDGLTLSANNLFRPLMKGAHQDDVKVAEANDLSKNVRDQAKESSILDIYEIIQ